jgi:transcriptional regulator with XRE-family HTH domain
MNMSRLTDREIARTIAAQLRAWRMDPRGAGMTQAELARRSGVGLTPLKRFEQTGGITLRNLVALLRALGLIDGLTTLIPSPETPSPLDLLAADRSARHRQRAPRAPNRTTPPVEKKRG